LQKYVNYRLIEKDVLNLQKIDGMERQIKLIWDFRGIDALKTAEHQEIHLKEFILIEQLPINITGFEKINDFHAIAFIVVNDDLMRKLRDVLKPHRGELYSEIV
jgi:hypothetical protein